MSGTTMRQFQDNEACMVAWRRYRQTEDYKNSENWARHAEHTEGSLWAAFLTGWIAATEQAAGIHEIVNPASDEERLHNDPGAGAMGAVIEYRDMIRRGLAP